jgi:hypothetical protein
MAYMSATNPCGFHIAWNEIYRFFMCDYLTERADATLAEIKDIRRCYAGESSPPQV